MEDNMKIEYIRRLKKKTRGRRQNKKDKEDKRPPRNGVNPARTV